MKSVLHKTMEFAYLDGGIPKVVSARVLIDYPFEHNDAAQHLLSSITVERSCLFVHDDEEVEMQGKNLVTDFVTWQFNPQRVIRIPRVKNTDTNRSCICCSMAEYFMGCAKYLLSYSPQAVDSINLDIVLADNDTQNFLSENTFEINSLFFEASVFVLSADSSSWDDYGLLYTDDSRLDGATIVLTHGERNLFSGMHLDICEATIEEGSTVLETLSDKYTNRFGAYNDRFFVKAVECI